MRYAGVFAFICAGAQAWAYSKSVLTAEQPIHCMAIPFGSCETIIASGYAAMLDGAAAGYDLPLVLAATVPLLMWLAVVLSGHNPQMWRRREGKRSLAPVAWLYLALLVAVLGYGASKLKKLPQPERVGALIDGAAGRWPRSA